MPFVAAVLALFALVLTAPEVAVATTVHVTKTADNVPGSLRETIAEANPNDTVQVPAGTYKLTAGEIAINKNLTIQGAGAPKTIVDAQGSSRVFNLTGGTYMLRGLTVEGGHDPSSGGGILSTAAGLTLDHVTVSDNRAGGGGATGTPGFGGGIYSDSPELTLKDSSVLGNHAGGGGPDGDAAGGGIALRASVDGATRSLSLERTVVTGNAAGGAGASGSGAGIDADSSANGVQHGSGTWAVSVTDTTVSRNVAGTGGNGGSGFGAGINVQVAGAGPNTVSLTADRATISNNNAGGSQASGYGGGISFIAGNSNDTHTMTLTNTTVSDNFGGGSSPYGGGTGGGIMYAPPSLGSSATLENVTVAGNTVASGTSIPSHGGGIGGSGVGLRNTIIAGNHASVGRNCQNPAAFSTHDVEDADTCGLTGDSQKNTNPKLLPLGDYGGPTLTRKLALDSLAIDKANPGFCPATDQRGVARDKNHCDVGAFELTHSDLALKGGASPAKVAVGRRASFGYKVTNEGPQDALAVKVTATIPKKLRFIAASGGTCTGKGTLTCALGTVSAGRSHTLKIIASPLHAGKIALHGTVNSGSGDANGGNNSANPSILALPAVQKLAVKPVSWRVGKGTSIRYTLSDGAKVRFTFALCTKLKKNQKTCAHYSKVGSLDRHGHAGKNKFHFDGEVPGVGELPVGRYRLSANAIDSQGNRSPARTALFKLRS